MPHTPGPWREYQDGVHPVFVGNAEPNGSFAICTGVHGPDAPFNKALIIAAPELLASLKESQAILAVLVDPANKATSSMMAWTACVAAETRARAAIAKAAAEQSA